MKKRNLYVLVLILVLTVGYAAVSTTLYQQFKVLLAESEDFKIIFSDSIVNGARKKETINENEDTIVFSTENLGTTDDVNTLDYEVANMSRNYDAEVSVSCSTTNADVVFLYQPEVNTVIAGESQKGRVELKVTKNQDIVKNDDITCMMNVRKVSRNELGNEYIPEYKDSTLNGADPVLDNDKLIPVKLASDGTVTVASTKEEWYNYENKEWANAVILKDIPSKTYSVGETILESDIESYFVWIPRYRYQIFDEGNYTEAIEGIPTESNAKEIKIEFESLDTPPSNGSIKDSWLTHPAFTNFNVNGLWVGKFETGYEGATSKTEAQVNEIASNKVIVKPNTYSWRGATVSNMFKTAYNYERKMDSHMMKNTEWGVVAYLSHSKYGISTEVNINNNSDYLTGYSAVEGTDQSSYPGTYGTDETVTLPYNTETGYKASTTGNITGIYDMSGGAWEYVAGYMPSPNDKSGFTTEELTNYSKYLDVYPSDSSIFTYNKRILGDAIGEMGPFYDYADKDGSRRLHNSWYNDISHFLSTSGSYFLRGGPCDHGGIAGQFSFLQYTGDVYGNLDSFRLVLAV